MTSTEDLLSEVRARRQYAPAEARRIRLAANVSQLRMAQALGVDRSTYTLWESGRVSPRRAHMEQWVKLLEQLSEAVA